MASVSVHLVDRHFDSRDFSLASHREREREREAAKEGIIATEKRVGKRRKRAPGLSCVCVCVMQH